MPQTSLTRDAYTVGIICALPLEKAAVTAMLDEEHSRLHNVAGDDNHYTFGRMAGHSVAIACLPAGTIGNVSAATVATDMMRSLPIKIGLMVGICGGVPSTTLDIRLGDVIVSEPTKQHGGVVYWTFGKTHGGGEFERTGTLDKPPRPLLLALSALKERHELEGSRVSEFVNGMLSKWPKMANAYGHPGSENDLLFISDYQHQAGKGCDGCDHSKLVIRPQREADDNIRFHYGNIASGDKVMKDGATRDRIAQAEGVICFEMEAAGLMDRFPCLVIRGVCDYADSHKHKEWQRYSASTAAAYAKELLGVIDPVEVAKVMQASEYWARA